MLSFTVIFCKFCWRKAYFVSEENLYFTSNIQEDTVLHKIKFHLSKCRCITAIEFSWNSKICSSCVCLCDNKAVLPRWRAFPCSRVLPKGDAVRLLFGREKQKPFELYSIYIKWQERTLLYLEYKKTRAGYFDGLITGSRARNLVNYNRTTQKYLTVEITISITTQF